MRQFIHSAYLVRERERERERCTVKELHVHVHTQTSKLYAETKAPTTETFMQHPLKQNKISLVHSQSLAALVAPPEGPVPIIYIYTYQNNIQ